MTSGARAGGVAGLLLAVVHLHAVASAAPPGRAARGAAAAAVAEAPAAPAHELALEKARTLRAEGKAEEALDVLRVATREVKKAAGETTPLLLPIYEAAADLLIDTEELEKADALLEKALALHRDLLAAGTGGDQAGYGRTLLVEARLHQVEGRLERALASAKEALLVLDAHAGGTAPDTLRAGETFQRAVAAFAELLGPDHEATVAARGTAADVEESLGRLPEAIAVRGKAVAALRTRLGPDAPATRSETERLNRLLLAAGRAADAIETQQATVAAGADGPTAAADLRLLGDLLLAVERFSEAEAAWQKALATDRATLGDTHPLTLLDRLAIMRIGLRSGRGEPAPEPLLECVTGLLPGGAGDAAAPEAVAGLLVAADVLAGLGDDERSRVCGLQARRAAEAHGEIGEPERVAALVAAARTRSAAPGSAARDGLESAVRAADERLGAGHPATHAAVLALAEAALAAGDTEAAATLVDRLLDRGVPRPDAAFEERLVALVDAVAAAREGDGESPRDRLVALRARQFGEEHPHTGLALALLGGRRFAADDAAAAVALCRRALAIQEAALGADHPETAGTALVLATALGAAKEPAAARPAFERALAVWERTAGPRHPVTLATVRGLTGATLSAGDTAAALPLLERLHTAYAADAEADAVAHARVLARTALVLAQRGDRERARAVVAEALSLPCWQQPPYADQSVFETLALTMGELARVFKTLDDADASTDAVRRARGIATRLASPRETLARIDALLVRPDVAADPL